jgi:hypothetical protein
MIPPTWTLCRARIEVRHFRNYCMVAGQRLCGTFLEPHARVEVVLLRHLHTPPVPTCLVPKGLRTCFRDGYQPRVAGRLREGMLTCRRPAYCMPHSHGLLYEEHQTLSCSCHTAGLRNGINRLGCWVRLMSRSRTLSPHAVSTGSWRMRLNVCEGPIFDITKVSSGGHRATVSKQGGGAADRLQI